MTKRRRDGQPKEEGYADSKERDKAQRDAKAKEEGYADRKERVKAQRDAKAKEEGYADRNERHKAQLDAKAKEEGYADRKERVKAQRDAKAKEEGYADRKERVKAQRDAKAKEEGYADRKERVKAQLDAKAKEEGYADRNERKRAEKQTQLPAVSEPSLDTNPLPEPTFNVGQNPAFTILQQPNSNPPVSEDELAILAGKVPSVPSSPVNVSIANVAFNVYGPVTLNTTNPRQSLDLNQLFLSELELTPFADNSPQQKPQRRQRSDSINSIGDDSFVEAFINESPEPPSRSIFD